MAHKAVARITIQTTGKVRAYLDQLVALGLHGESVEDAADMLVCRGLQSLMEKGLIRPLEKPRRRRAAGTKRNPPATR